MPVKKKVKKIKLKSMRGARAARAATKKPNVKQTVNVFTTSTEPYRTDFRDQYRYGLGYVEREQTPFQPVFNYIQPPVQQPVQQPMPSMVSSSEIKKVEVEAKPKRKSTKKPVAIGVVFEEPSFSRQSSVGGYESEFFMPSEERAIMLKQKQEKEQMGRIARAYQESQESSPEFVSSEMPSVISKPKGKGGRPKGSTNKPKEAVAQASEKPQFTSTLTQPDIMSFFGKTGGGSKINE